MAKKKQKVKMKKPLSAMTGPIGPSIPSAMTGPMAPNLIGANIGRAQQLEAAEQSQMVDSMRKKAKDKLATMKKATGAAPANPGMNPVMPPGTFKNAEDELVIGDMKKFQASQGKRTTKVKKKK